jgi:hypothetical protein
MEVTSSGSAGYGTTLSVMYTIMIDNGYNYTIIVAPNANNDTLQVCGVRIAYYTPAMFGSALPIIKRLFLREADPELVRRLI